MEGEAKRVSNIFYFSRVIAIIAVVTAHTPFHECSNMFLVHMIDMFSCLGVAVFFFSAGYYFKAQSSRIKKRLLKMSWLLIPWSLFGSFSYLVEALSRGFSVFEYIKWIIGYGTYLWFMTVYVIMNALFEIIEYIQKEKIKEILYWVLFFGTITSRILTPIFDISGVSAFFNLFNWLGFFALGKLLEIKKINFLFEKKGSILRGGICIVLLAIFFALDCILDASIGYWGYTSVFEQLSWIGLILSVAAFWENMPSIISHIGKNTLPIYLLHIVPLQWVCAQFPIIIYAYIPLSVCIVVILFIALWGGSLLAKHVKVEKIYEKVVGFKA